MGTLGLEKKLLTILVLFSLVPLNLLYIFLPFDVDYLYLFFVVLLVVLRLSLLNDAPFKEGLEKKVIARLQKKDGKIPSKNKIVKYIDLHLQARDWSLGIAIVLVLLTAIFHGKL